VIEHRCDVAVVGSGAGGLAAAVAAREAGAREVLVLERDNILGGILPQCIHTGFGLEIFSEDLTGPEYIHRFVARALELQLPTALNTMVLEITSNRELYAASPEEGLLKIKAGAVVLAMGCRERTRGALAIPGTRPAGIMTAGLAQRFVNIEGYMPGERIVVLGSGDVGMIMARRFTFEGAHVEAVVEILPYIGGLIRNKVQCLDDYGIPLFLEHTVTEILGNMRVTGVKIAKVNEDLEPILETGREIACDTLVLSVGLIPENELSEKLGVEMDSVTGGPLVNELMETSIPGIFACGNVVHVCDIVDNVTQMGLVAGKSAARFALEGPAETEPRIRLRPGENVRYVVPQTISAARLAEAPLPLHLRVARPDENVRVSIVAGRRCIFDSREKAVAPGEALIASIPTSAAEFLAQVDELQIDVQQVK